MTNSDNSDYLLKVMNRLIEFCLASAQHRSPYTPRMLIDLLLSQSDEYEGNSIVVVAYHLDRLSATLIESIRKITDNPIFDGFFLSPKNPFSEYFLDMFSQNQAAAACAENLQ